MEISQIIKSRRKELHLTMREIAESVGVSEATISRWESGNISNMRRDKIALLAKVLRLSPTELIEDTITDETLDIVNSLDDDILEQYGSDLSKAQAEQRKRDEAQATSIIKNYFSAKETELLNDFLTLNELGKDKAIEYVKDLSSMDKYSK